ncbi:MAG: hypothetical protein WBZ37_23620, partial [Mycobacterium sp.]
NRRHPAPRRAAKISSSYVARNANGQALACVYSRATESDATQAKVLTAAVASGLLYGSTGATIDVLLSLTPINRPMRS